MKCAHLFFALSLGLTILIGCGGGNNFGGGNVEGNGGQTSPPPNGFAENWHFEVSSSSLTIDAALTLSSNSVVGVAHFQSYSASAPCPSFFDNLPLSGTIDGQGRVSIKSSAVMGVVLSIDGALSSGHASLLNGNYHFTGGCMNGQTGPLTGVKVKPLTGLYTGSMQWSGHTVNISTQLTQALSSDKDGFFALSGTLAISNSCDETFTLAGASVVGGVVHLYSNTGTQLEGLTGVMESDAQEVELDDYPYLGDCIAGAHGIITRQ